MFYELIGDLLTRGGDALTDRHSDRGSGDERTQREFRQIALLMRRVGAIWPSLFASLEQETDILSATLERVSGRLADAGLNWDRAVFSGSDPLQHYRYLLTELDRAVIALHEVHDQPWAAEALRDLRHGLAEAAEVQGELVDRALAL